MKTKENTVTLGTKNELEFRGCNILCVPNEEIKLRKGFTGADWWWDEQDILQVRIATELPDWRERAALALHEAFEALVCRHMGITVAMVDVFDAKFKGENEYDINAGDDPDAPYRIPHTYATAIERVFTGVCGVDWYGYDRRLEKI
jgi:hypothetical protein